MIGTSIALAIWTTGLLYLTSKSEKKRLLEAQGHDVEEKIHEAGVVHDAKA